MKETFNYSCSGNPPTSYVGCSPSIALSTQNDASPYLYTSFVLWDHPSSTSYQIGLKTNNWNTTIGFKPSGETKINEEETKTDGFQVFPNPFKSSFSLKTQIDETKTCDLTIYNLLGQKIYSGKGTISELNKELKDIGNKLESGSYFIKLQPEKGKAFHQKLLKL